MAATDDLRKFNFKPVETEKFDRVESYGRGEPEYDTYDLSDRFEFDMGSDDLGF